MMEDNKSIEEKLEDALDSQEDQFLTFCLADQEYGFEIRYVTEIIGIQKVTKLPDLPHFVKGVINLRGRVIPVVDVRLRFSMEERTYDERTCIVVVNLNDTSVGLVVDTVSEVMNIPADNVEPAPKVSNRSIDNQYVQGLAKVDNQVKILLNIPKLLFENELEHLKEIVLD